jgi:hypothetical protein
VIRNFVGYYAPIDRDDVEFKVEFSYIPGTPGYPGDPAELKIIKLELWGVDLLKAIPDEELEKIERYLEENIYDYIEKDGGY